MFARELLGMLTDAAQSAVDKVSKLAIEIGDSFSSSNSVSQLMGHAARAQGWQAWTEVSASYVANGKTRKGRIDLMVVVDGQAIGVEVDHYVVKEKSIAKLQTLSSLAARVAILTGSADVTQLPEGIDAVLCVRSQRLLTKKGLTVIA